MKKWKGRESKERTEEIIEKAKENESREMNSVIGKKRNGTERNGT